MGDLGKKKRKDEWWKKNPEKSRAACARWREKNKEKARALCTAWRLANRERALEATRKWRAANPEKLKAAERNRDPVLKLAKGRRHYERHKVELAAQHRAWAAQNKDKVRAGFLRWYADNYDKVLAGNSQRRARKKGATGSHTATEWRCTLDYFNQACAYCLKYIATPHREHIVPLIGGGSDYIENIVPACPRCNKRKGRKSLLQFLQVSAGA